MEPNSTPEATVDDAELERQVRERAAKREQREQEAAEAAPRSGGELIQAAGKNEKLSEAEIADATEWLLSSDPEDFTHEIEINVGTPKKAKWINWEIKPVDLDTLRRIRKAATEGSTRAQRRAATGDLDEVEANLRIVVEGTVTPNLREAANQARLVDPADILRRRFGHKPGLLGQIAGEIMSISGYDDEDVREVDAAGN
jgi:hypothetical protein